jgi:hypothetical protein
VEERQRKKGRHTQEQRTTTRIALTIEKKGKPSKTVNRMIKRKKEVALRMQKERAHENHNKTTIAPLSTCGKSKQTQRGREGEGRQRRRRCSRICALRISTAEAFVTHLLPLLSSTCMQTHREGKQQQQQKKTQAKVLKRKTGGP